MPATTESAQQRREKTAWYQNWQSLVMPLQMLQDWNDECAQKGWRRKQERAQATLFVAARMLQQAGELLLAELPERIHREYPRLLELVPYYKSTVAERVEYGLENGRSLALINNADDLHDFQQERADGAEVDAVQRDAAPAQIIDFETSKAIPQSPAVPLPAPVPPAVREIPLVRLQMVRDKTLPYCGEDLDETFKVYKLFKQIVGESPVEHVLVFCVDTKNRLTHAQVLSIGTIDNALVSPAEVIKVALLSNARAVLLAHNHPSGEVEPSNEDRDITRRLERALPIVGLQLLDHLIIGDERCYSFTAQKVIELAGLSRYYGRKSAPKNPAQELKQGYNDDQLDYVRRMIEQMQAEVFKRPRRYAFSARSLAKRLGYQCEGGAAFAIEPLATPPKIHYPLGRDALNYFWRGLLQCEIVRRWERLDTLQRIEQGVPWIDEAAARWIAQVLFKELFVRW